MHQLYLETIMESKQELLTYIIENNIFASSWSALAKRINYTNRTLPSRLKKGTVKEATAENVLNQICHCFEISGDELLATAFEIQKGKILFEIIKSNNPYSKKQDGADKILVDFVKSDFENYSEYFKNEVVPHLMELKKNNPDIYCGMTMILYTKLKKINPYEGNINHFHQKLKDLTSHIASILRNAMPENLTGHNVSLAYLADNIIRNAPQCIWGIMLYNIHILRYFSDSDYLNQMLLSGTTFPEWGDFSYWHKAGASYGKGKKIWTLLAQKSDSAFHGIYTGQTFEVGKDNETFIPQENFALIFWNKENDDDTEAVIQVSDIINSEKNTFTVYYGKYSYNQKDEEITINWENDQENVLNLPSKMKRINMGKVLSREEQIWNNITRKFDNNDSIDKFQESLTKKTNIEYLFNTYEIQDVTINRKQLTLSLLCNEQTEQYTLPIDTYPFLKTLNVFDDICIKRNTLTNELFVEWPSKGYHIPLSRFVKAIDFPYLCHPC